MTLHHIVKESEIDGKCLYCGNMIKEWQLGTLSIEKYKQANCDCGHTHHIRMDFKNNAHCKWMKEEVMHREGHEETRRTAPRSEIRLEQMAAGTNQERHIEELLKRTDYVIKFVGPNKL